MWLKQMIIENRRFIFSFVLAIAIPGLAIFALGNFATVVSEEDSLEVAAVAVKNYIDENPLYNRWEATKIHKDHDEERVIVHVHVPKHKHAKVIKSRNKRIRYSYLKLACPGRDAWLYKWFDDTQELWVKLHHHGEELLTAPCPKPLADRFMTDNSSKQRGSFFNKFGQSSTDG